MHEKENQKHRAPNTLKSHSNRATQSEISKCRFSLTSPENKLQILDRRRRNDFTVPIIRTEGRRRVDGQQRFGASRRKTRVVIELNEE